MGPIFVTMATTFALGMESNRLPACSVISVQLRQHLPPIAEGCGWHLSYGSENHGYSINTLYRNVHRVQSPVLLVIKTAAQEVRSHSVSMVEAKTRITLPMTSGKSWIFFLKIPGPGKSQKIALVLEILGN